MTEPETSPPGLDLDQLTRWWSSSIQPVAGELRARLLTGGKSNLTYEVSDDSAAWVVRRPPLGHVLATAHDMKREYTVMTALRETPVPVPATFALVGEEGSPLGAQFYVMEKVNGTPYRFATELEPLGAGRTRAIALRLIDTLAALHSVDPVAVGLGEFGRAQGYLPRQVARWAKQMAASKSRDLLAADELHAKLAAAIPPDQPATIVHGDYRLDNVLFDAGDQPAAVLDWEMATLGDPLADLALMLLYGRLGLMAGQQMVSDVSRAPGYPGEAEIIQRYATESGRDISKLGFYLGLSAYKLAAILEGIHYRYIQGQTVGPGFDGIGDTVHALLKAGLAAIEEVD